MAAIKISLVASTVCGIHDTHLTRNENSEPVVAVITTDNTASDHTPKVVGKFALQTGREMRSVFLSLGWYLACPRGQT